MSDRLAREYTLTFTVKSTKGVYRSSIAERMKEMMDNMDVDTILKRLEVKEITKVVNIDFFTRDTLPPRLEAIAKEQDVQLGPGLVVVKTRIGPPLSYDFDSVGTSPEEIQSFMRRLAEQDGVDLGKAVKKAFSEEEPVR